MTILNVLYTYPILLSLSLRRFEFLFLGVLTFIDRAYEVGKHEQSNQQHLFQALRFVLEQSLSIHLHNENHKNNDGSVYIWQRFGLYSHSQWTISLYTAYT